MTQTIKSPETITDFGKLIPGNNLAKYRTMKNETQRDAAMDLGLTQPQLSNYEAMDSIVNLKFSLLFRMAKYYETDIESLVFEMEA